MVRQVSEGHREAESFIVPAWDLPRWPCKENKVWSPEVVLLELGIVTASHIRTTGSRAFECYRSTQAWNSPRMKIRRTFPGATKDRIWSKNNCWRLLDRFRLRPVSLVPLIRRTIARIWGLPWRRVLQHPIQLGMIYFSAHTCRFKSNYAMRARQAMIRLVV